MSGLRRRLRIFWLFANVQNATLPSRKPYHMATRWGWPDGPIVATFSVRGTPRKASTSAGVITICSRRLAIAAP